jgi:hypothetical protein
MQECVAVRAPTPRVRSVLASAATTWVEPPLVRVVAGPGVDPPVAPATAAPGWACDTAPDRPNRRFSLRRAVAYASPLLAAAAAIPLWMSHGSDPEFELALAVERGQASEHRRASEPDPATASRRSVAAHTGDVVRPSVRGEHHRAIRVFLDEHRLVAACPEDPGCRDAGGELTLELHLTAPGKYAVIGLGSSDPLAAPGATLEQTQIAARRAGIYTQIKRLDVE